MKLSKREKIEQWIKGGKDYTFNSLQLDGNRVYTYAVLLAHVNRADKVVHVNTQHYSHTSTVHLGLIKVAAHYAGYSVTEYSEESSLFGLA